MSDSEADADEGDPAISDSDEDSEESENLEKYDKNNIRVGEVVAQVGRSKGSPEVWLGLVQKVGKAGVTVVYLEPNSTAKKGSMIERCRGTWDKSKFVGGKSKGQEWVPEEVVPFSRVCAKVKFEDQDLWKVDLKLGIRYVGSVAEFN